MSGDTEATRLLARAKKDVNDYGVKNDVVRRHVPPLIAEVERLRARCVVLCDDDCDAACHMGHEVSWKRPLGRRAAVVETPQATESEPT